MRPVLSPINHTVQGKLGNGFALHRKTASLSPRPGPGAHATSVIDNAGRPIWLQQLSPRSFEAERVKAKVGSWFE